jgi:ABC-type glycerol-3-phosphate transport system substrate-binding protein
VRGPRFLAWLAALIAALALAACGGDDEGESSSGDERQIEAVIGESVGSDDPDACTEVATLAFLEQTELAKGDAAIDSCIESTQDESDDPDSVEVSAVEVDGATATANVAFEGGSFDGQSLSVSLVDSDGWKLDRIEDLIDFDPGLFGDQFAANPPDAVTEERAQCLGDEFGSADPDQLEAAILSGDPDELAPYFAACPG